jgi:hypothetical protein
MTTEEVIERGLVPSPGGWEAPKGSRPGRSWMPEYARAAPERVPWWVRLWSKTPLVDRFADEWIWRHGGYLVLPPDHPLSQRYGPAEYEALTGMSKAQYERELLDVAREEFETGSHDVLVSLEQVDVVIDGEGVDTRIVVLFGLADRPGQRFGFATALWPSPHPDDYEGTPEWGWLLPEFVRIAIEHDEGIDGQPDAQGIVWLT